MGAVLKIFTAARPAWLRHLIRTEVLKYIKLNLSEGDQLKLNQYLQQKLKLSSWSVLRIVAFALDHLQFQTNGTDQVVSLDPYLLLPDTSYRVADLVQLIDYGNLEVRGTHLFKRAFKWVQLRINSRILRGII